VAAVPLVRADRPLVTAAMAFVPDRKRARMLGCSMRFAAKSPPSKETPMPHRLFRPTPARLACAGLWFAAAMAPPFVAAAPAADETAKTAAAVIAVDQHWLDAEVGGDTAWLDRMLLPDYRSVDSKGVAHPKAAIVAHAAKNRGSDVERRKVEAWIKAHPSGKSVVIRGDTAILSFYDPKLGPQQGVRSSDIFVYEDGHWHALYSQHSAAGGG
jgi:hypothetical protein